MQTVFTNLAILVFLKPMSLKTFGFGLFVLFFVATVVYVGIWFWQDRAMAQIEETQQAEDCPKLVIRATNLDIEKIYLSLEQNTNLIGNPDMLTLQNENLGLTIAVSQEELNLKTTKSVWQFSSDEQTNFGEIIAATVGTIFGSDSDIVESVRSSLTDTNELTLENKDKVLNLSFQCV